MDSINSNKKITGSSTTEIETDNVVEYFTEGKEKLSSTLQDDQSVESSSNDDNENSNKKYSITQPHLRKFIDSFKKPDHVVRDLEDPNDMDSADNGEGKLKSTIKPRHVLMMSLGTGIGTGLLVGNATALGNAGPAGLVIGTPLWVLVCIVLSKRVGNWPCAIQNYLVILTLIQVS